MPIERTKYIQIFVERHESRDSCLNIPLNKMQKIESFRSKKSFLSFYSYNLKEIILYFLFNHCFLQQIFFDVRSYSMLDLFRRQIFIDITYFSTLDLTFDVPMFDVKFHKQKVTIFNFKIIKKFKKNFFFFFSTTCRPPWTRTRSEGPTTTSGRTPPPQNGKKTNDVTGFKLFFIYITFTFSLINLK